MATIRVGDTVQVNVVFRDWDVDDDYGDPVDPPEGVTVVVYDQDRDPLADYVPPVSADPDPNVVGRYSHVWTPEEAGIFYVEFTGDFGNDTTVVIEEEFWVEVVSEEGIKLGEDQELHFATEASPLYVDPEEFFGHYPEAGMVEILEFTHRYSLEVQKYFKDDDIPFVALEYIRAAVLCSLSRIFDYGVGGDESSVALGDLKITSRTYPRLKITRANAVNWCELAAVLRAEMLAAASSSKTYVRGSKYDNPMPKRKIRSPYGGSGRRSF